MKDPAAFSAFKIIHRAMIIGQLSFIAVVIYLVYNKTVVPPLADRDKILQIIAIVFTAIAFFLGGNIFKKKIALIKEDINLSTKERFEKYRSACIVQWALLEGAILFCGICLFLTGNYAFSALAAALILLFAMLAPNKNKMALQLGLSPADMDDL